MPKPSRRSRNTPKPIPTIDPLTRATFMIPRLSDPTEIVAVEIEDGGYDDGTGCYVTRFRFADQAFRNEFDPRDVPFGALSDARAIANAGLLAEHFDLDLGNAERMAS